MNLVQIITTNSSCSKYRKAQNVTLLFVNRYKRVLIQYGIQDGCQRRKILLWDFFSYVNISEIFMSEISLNCNECLFLIYNMQF